MIDMQIAEEKHTHTHTHTHKKKSPESKDQVQSHFEVRGNVRSNFNVLEFSF